jgi:hypothetical protein
MYNPDSSQYSFTKFLKNLELDKQGRVKIDPNTGAFIPASQRRSAQNVRRNPYNVRPGTAINPDVSFFDDILARANPAPAMQVDPNEMMRRAGY